MIRALIFDLWETLGTKNVGISQSFFEHFDIPSEKRSMSAYETSAQLTAWNTEEEMAKALLIDFAIEPTDEAIVWTCDLFKEGITKATLFPGMKELLGDLKQGGYRLGFISNTTVFEAAVLDKWGIRELFDAVTFSWEEGIKKPDARIFMATLEKLGAGPEEAIFIDDGEKNISAASALGISGIQFSDCESLKKQLKYLGIKGI